MVPGSSLPGLLKKELLQTNNAAKASSGPVSLTSEQDLEKLRTPSPTGPTSSSEREERSYDPANAPLHTTLKRMQSSPAQMDLTPCEYENERISLFVYVSE